MLFNSLEFFIFFPLVTILFFALPHKFRWFLLLTASCIFYMAFIPAYILILFITIIIDFFAGIYIERSLGRERKLILVLSLISNLALLAFFKYFNFFNDNISLLMEAFGSQNAIENLSILLPVGLSFHTFQSMSYTIEVYRKNQRAEKHFGIYSLYVMFYPQLVAGPIERPQNLLPQFYEKKYFEYTRVTDGLKLMLWGFFKKIVIADRLAIYVDQVYDHPAEYHGIPLIIATIFFAFQIYCDFSGYSDIAIGAAQVMGFKLMDNFNRPYFSKSVSEFWQRWHISLSTWFKDYVYFPLGGNRVAIPRWCINIFITFAISGLWHGANWTYIVWGGLNGVFLIIEGLTKRTRKALAISSGLSTFPSLQKYISIFITFALICFTWIFFRAQTMSDALLIIKNMFVIDFNNITFNVLEDKKDFILGIAAILFMESIHLIQRHRRMRHFLSEKPVWLRWGIYTIILWAILIFGVFGEREFIYFVF